MNGLVEEGDLPLVVFLESKVAVPADALAGHALGLDHLGYRIVSPGLAVMASEIVIGRKVESKDLDGKYHANLKVSGMDWSNLKGFGFPKVFSRYL